MDSEMDRNSEIKMNMMNILGSRRIVAGAFSRRMNNPSLQHYSWISISFNIGRNHFSSVSSTATTPTKKRLRERPAAIRLTTSAANRIKELLSTRDDAVGVKIGVKRRGCNGYSYTMNYATIEDLNSKKDEVVEEHGVKVLVDPKAIFFIVGTEMDYSDTELSSEFTFHNPNSKGQCGCGESFNV